MLLPAGGPGYDGALECIPTSGLSGTIFTSALIGSATDRVSGCENRVVIVRLECCLAELADNREVSHRRHRSTSLPLPL